MSSTVYIEGVQIRELEELLRRRGANVAAVRHIAGKDLVKLCDPAVKVPRFRQSFERQAEELDREIGVQPVAVVAVRVKSTGKIVCYPNPVEFPEHVSLLTFFVEAKGQTQLQEERYALDILRAAKSILKFSLPEAEIRTKLPLAWAESRGARSSESLGEVEPPAAAGLARGVEDVAPAEPRQTVDRTVNEVLKRVGIDPEKVDDRIKEIIAEAIM
ncbi:MAG: hypothetical protein ACP5I3_12060, partial [Thermoproteus sp.]